MSRFVLGFALISGICLFSFTLYDYYFNNGLDGLVIYLFLSIAWFISLICSIIFALKSFHRISLVPLLVNIISILISICFSLLIPATSLKRYTLPRLLSNKDLKSYKFIEYSNDSSYYIILMYKESDMAFGSGHNLLGLYAKSNKILDECTFGAFPIEFDTWNGDTIKLKTKLINKDIYTFQYVNSWIGRNNKIKNFNIHFEIEQ